MRTSVLVIGLYLLILGSLMPLLLSQLATVTFRGDIPSWRTASYPIVAVGLTLFLIALLGGSSRHASPSLVAKAYGYATLANIVVAAIFISPILIPTLEFPILITRWPGIYMVAAYFSFVAVGILGSLGWSIVYSDSTKLYNKASIDRGSSVVQFALYQIGIYGLAFFMFWGGYIGSTLSYEGIQDAMVGIIMEPAVIPSALFIYTLIFSVVLGVVNLVFGKPQLPNIYQKSETQVKENLMKEVL
jgi:hypothetical protein